MIKKILVGVMLSELLAGSVYAAYPYSVSRSPSTGDTINILDINTSNQEHITNNIPNSIDDYSANVAQMQEVDDPGEVGSESLATTLDEEIQRLRNIIKEITGEAQWYVTPTVMTMDVTNTRVGISTTSPDVDFEVLEDTASGVAQIFATQITTDATGGEICGRKARGSEGSESAVNAADTIARFTARAYDNAGWESVAAEMRAAADENWDATSHGTHLAFHTTDNTTTTLDERVRIDHNGNVGIGNTNPQAKLAVEGAIQLSHATSNSIYRDINTDAIFISGGSGASTGGHMELYGGAHATQANNAFYDADIHTFRAQDAATTYQVVLNTNAGSHSIQVTGTAGLSTGTAWTNTSDKRIKKDIETITDGLDKILAFRPVRFHYIPEYLNEHEELDPDRMYVSFIADEYELVDPDGVTVGGDMSILRKTKKKFKPGKPAKLDEEGNVISEAIPEEPAEKEDFLTDLKQLNTSNLVPYLVSAVQTLEARIKVLEGN